LKSPSSRIKRATGVQGLFIAFGFVISVFFPYRSIYLAQRGLSPSQIGIVIAIMAAAGAMAGPIWGHLADTRIGRLRALQFAVVGAAVASLSINLIHGLWPIAAMSFGLSAFGVATGPNIDAIALEHLGPERMSNYGYIRGWESLSYAAGCLVYGSTLQILGAQWVMPLHGLACLAMAVWTVAVVRDKPVRQPPHGRLGAVGAVFRQAPRFWRFLIAVLLLWTGFNAAWNFIGLKIESHGGGPLLIGLGAAAGGLVEIPVMRYSATLQKRWGLRRVYATGCCVYALGFLLWGLVSNPTVVSFLTMFEGLAFGLLFTTGVMVVGRLVPPSLYATGASMVAMVGFGLGPILGAGLGGFVYKHAGPMMLYSGASALALGGAVAAWFALAGPELADHVASPATGAS
jgi:MFS transporter, PPP family, 3-phenylpropionic acid transporter